MRKLFLISDVYKWQKHHVQFSLEVIYKMLDGLFLASVSQQSVVCDLRGKIKVQNLNIIKTTVPKCIENKLHMGKLR